MAIQEQFRTLKVYYAKKAAIYIDPQFTLGQKIDSFDYILILHFNRKTCICLSAWKGGMLEQCIPSMLA